MNKKRLIMLMALMFVFVMLPVKAKAAVYEFKEGTLDFQTLSSMSFPAGVTVQRNAMLNGVACHAIVVDVNGMTYDKVMEFYQTLTKYKMKNELGPFTVLYIKGGSPTRYSQEYTFKMSYLNVFDNFNYIVFDVDNILIEGEYKNYKGVYIEAKKVIVNPDAMFSMNPYDLKIHANVDANILKGFVANEYATKEITPIDFQEKYAIPVIPVDSKKNHIVIHAPSNWDPMYDYSVQKVLNGKVVCEKRFKPGEVIYQSSDDVKDGVAGKAFELILKRTGKKFNCTLNANGGTISSKNFITAYKEKVATLPTPTRKGYTFKGWIYSDKKPVKAGDVYPYKNAQTMTAQWQVNKYKVTLDYADGKTKSVVLDVTYDQPYGNLPVIARDGYTFAGWMAADKTIVDSNTKVATDKNHTLTATWKENNYSVTVKPKKVKGAKGYEIKLCSNKKFKKKKGGYNYLATKKVKKNKCKFTGIKVKGTYYFKYRSYEKVNGKKVYSKWTKAKKITVK